MSSPSRRRRSSNPLMRLFSGSGSSTNRDQLGLTKTTLRLVPPASSPPMMGAAFGANRPVSSPSPTSLPPPSPVHTTTSSFAVFQTKMLKVEYEAEDTDSEASPGRVAYAPVELPRLPVPRVKITKPDNIPFELRPEEILPEWIVPWPPKVSARVRTWEQELAMARRVWRTDTDLSFEVGKPEVLSTRKIMAEELEQEDEADIVGDIVGRRQSLRSFVSGEPEILSTHKDRKIGRETRGLPETPPESPRGFMVFDADAHQTMSSYSSLKSQGEIEGVDNSGKRSITRHVRNDSLTRSQSVRSRKRSGSTASQGSSEAGSPRTRRISIDFALASPLPTPPISPPTPTAPMIGAATAIGSNSSYGDETGSPRTYSYHNSYNYRAPPYDPDADTDAISVISDVSSLSGSAASLSSSVSLSSGSLHSRSGTTSFPNSRRGSFLFSRRRSSAGWGGIAEESGQKTAGKVVAGEVGYSNGDYYYQQYHQMQDIHEEIGGSEGDGMGIGTGMGIGIGIGIGIDYAGQPQPQKMPQVELDVKQMYAPPGLQTRRRSSVARKSLPQNVMAGDGPLKTQVEPQKEGVVKAGEESWQEGIEEKKKGEAEEEEEVEAEEEEEEGEEEEEEEEEDDEDEEQAQARLRRMREIAEQLTEENDRRAKEYEMQRAARLAGLSKVNIIKRKPVMKIAQV